MSKITSLSKEQEARLSEYRDRWLRYGLSTEPANRPAAENGIVQSYMAAGLKAPRIVWCASPMSNALTRKIVFDLQDSVEASVGDSVGDSVWDSVLAVRDAIWDAVEASVGDSVGDSVWDSVLAVRDLVGASVGASVRESEYGQHEAHWLGFYEYFLDVCGLHDETKKLNGLLMVAKNAGWLLPHENICWVSERHSTLHLNSLGQPHCQDGLAIGYPDGWGVYALNGVRMEKWQVMTPPEKLEPRQILKVANVEQRRELIRKVGIERFIHGSGAVAKDVRGDYELLDVWLSEDMPHARFLKMKNPSIGVWHVEGVAPGCQTVQQAINWRAGNISQEWKPSILT